MEAQAWYESRATGLGLEFARSIDAAIASAVRDPEAFAPIVDDCRNSLAAAIPVFRGLSGSRRRIPGCGRISSSS